MIVEALYSRMIKKPKVNKETGEIEEGKVREKQTLTKAFWKPILEETDFKEFVKTYYSIGHKPLLEVELELAQFFAFHLFASRECISTVAAGAQTRRSLGHHLLHQHYLELLVLITVCAKKYIKLHLYDVK